jgi:hypothetical protein
MTRTSFSRFAFLLVATILLTVSVASAAGPYQFFSVTPCRLADTRPGFGFSGLSGPPALSAGTPRNFPVAGLCGVPTDAKAAALNVTVVSPTLEGFIKIWPSNLPLPAVSTINFAAGEPAIANGAIVPMAVDQQGNTLAGPQISLVYGTAVPGGTTNLILDVTGFFK